MRNSYADKTLAEVTKILKEIRLKKGLSHETLATKAKITRPGLSFIESGSRKPSLLVCLRIAEALGTSLADVISEAEKRGRKG